MKRSLRCWGFSSSSTNLALIVRQGHSLYANAVCFGAITASASLGRSPCVRPPHKLGEISMMATDLDAYRQALAGDIPFSV